MTSLRTAFVLITALSFSGCLGGTGILSFPIHETIDEQTVNGSPIPAALGGAFPFMIPMNIDLSAETAARGTGPANHVYLRSLSLDITATAEPAPDTDDFDFLDSIDIYIESTKSGTTLERRKIAHITTVPTGVKHVSFSIDRVDLIDYVNEGSRLTSEATGNFPPDDVTFDGEISLSVEVF